MPEPKDLSPWAHPKASKWFDVLLERSGLIEEIETQLHKDDDIPDIESARLLISILAMLGRPGIWPERHQRVLVKAASKVNRMINQQCEKSETRDRKKKKPLTLEQHQRSAQASIAIEVELEMVRRWGGASNRQSPIKQPPSWGEFWG